jgi:hypothetical protein
MAKDREQVLKDRVAEYVNSPMMTHRMRYKKQLSARIHGNFGVYRTQVSQNQKAIGNCTCPSDWSPCKHIQALRQTWKTNPQSFLDLEEFLAELSSEPKARLVTIIRDILLEWPECLSLFGVPGFEEGEDQDDWEEY